jgi:hypothetical protein
LWWFQDFKDRHKPAITGLEETELKQYKIRDLLCASPKSAEKIVKASLNLAASKTLSGAATDCEKTAKSTVVSFSAVAVGKQLIKNAILENISEDDLEVK